MAKHLLYNRVPKEEGEYIWSYMARELLANGVSVGSMLFRDHVAGDRLHYAEKTRYTMLRGYDALEQTMEMTKEEIVKLFLETSLFPLEKYLVASWQEIAYIINAFQYGDIPSEQVQLRKKLMPNYSQVQVLKLCPECRKEDMEKLGFHYYRRDHQAPGVTVCAKHGVPLEVYAGPHGEEFSPGIETEAVSCDLPIQIQEDYARLISGVLNNFRSEDEMQGRAEELLSKVGRQADADVSKTLRKLAAKQRGTISQMDFQKLLEERELKLVSDFDGRGPLILRHKCGTEFISSARAVAAGFTCPVCDGKKSDDEMLSVITKSLTKGKFNLVQYNGSADVILRDADGEELKTAWNNVVENKVITPAHRVKVKKETLEYRKRKVRECFGDDYEYAEKVDNDTLRIRHIPTGELFDSKWSNILKGLATAPQQWDERAEKIMEERQRITKEHFGEEYEIAEWIDNEHVTYRNTITGETFTKQWRAVTGGSARIPSETLLESERKYMDRDAVVKKCFGDDYELVSYLSVRHVIIRHIPSGREFSKTWKPVFEGRARSPWQEDEDKDAVIKEVYGEDHELVSFHKQKVTVRNNSTGDIFTKSWGQVRKLRNRKRKEASDET